ncbi:MiaB/RimO family radical SAM methylthiotransferase, partial [Promineifilum sp.]|uniref:MiaB/RimO family radical SAM methylthiotransferase n=1 Tax=Promineifilum sp. TaxID=2664178 RepID=UPI0035B30442
ADTVILNTCAVTAEAARDARNLTRRFARANGEAEIVLTGCYAAIAPDELAALPGVGRVVGNADKERIPLLLDPALPADRPLFDREPLSRETAAGSMGRTRGFIKVQDGCDNRCTFCVTTIARGAGRSRRLGDVVAEVQAFAAAGYREVVLTGVHLGSYGRDLGRPAGLAELTAALLADTDVPRLRLSSLEPWDVAPNFFRLWENPRLLPHLHLPLQSGSDRVLRRMARRTSQASFRALADEARAHIPDLNLSTDLIAGFPGETDEEHAETLAYVAELAFGRLHVFPYSPRPGTAAARLPGQVPGPVKKERARQLIALGERLGAAFHARYDGATRPVLWEQAVGAEPEGLRWVGYTDNYIRVAAIGPADLMNRVTPVQLGGATASGMSGALAVLKA